MSIIDDIKSVATTINQAGNIELYQKIINIQSQVADLLGKNIELQKNNQELANQVVDKKTKDDIAKSLIFRGDTYFQGENGPYCSKCWDSDDKLVRLHTQGRRHAQCPNCHTVVIAEGHRASGVIF